MLVYLTKPDNHELVIGGWRSVRVWTDKPSFYHIPTRGYAPIDSSSNEIFVDIGWAHHGDRKDSCAFKPLAKQNAILEENAWKLLTWSCTPKAEKLHVDQAHDWTAQESKQHPGNTNWQALMYHIGGETDQFSLVHHKRLLIEANLVTGECRLTVPRVFYFHGSHEDTLDIWEPYTSRRNYACPEIDDIPF
jgi:hypothetical protein